MNDQDMLETVIGVLLMRSGGEASFDLDELSVVSDGKHFIHLQFDPATFRVVAKLELDETEEE